MARSHQSPAVLAPALAPRLLRRQAAADYLSISPAFLDALRAQGHVRPVQLPAALGVGTVRCPLYDVRDLDDLIEKFKKEGAA